MELWIKNQNKTALIKVDRIVLEIFDNMKPTIYSNDDFLGEYETKERALEVLDEIQNILMPMVHYEPIVKEKIDYSKPYIEKELVGSKYEIQEISTYVYEMPED